MLFAGIFTNIVARWPGCTHDSHIFRTSRVGRELHENGHGLEDGVLLGDSGYACTTYLMTPFLNPTTQQQEQYNRTHKVTRCVIERTFGLLKRRFHILHSEIRMAPDRVCTIIAACCVLQNIAINMRESDLDDCANPIQLMCDVQELYHGPENGHAVRQHITNTFF